MVNLFSVAHDIRIHSANNRKLAVLFDTLAEDGLICRDWQKVISNNGIIQSFLNVAHPQS